MAVNGKKFLDLNRCDEIKVSGHALDRLYKRTGVGLTARQAAGLFTTARQLRPFDLVALGYRPRYGRRRHLGQETWYFLMSIAGREAISVVTRDRVTGQLVWATTYAPNMQTRLFRALEPRDVALAM